MVRLGLSPFHRLSARVGLAISIGFRDPIGPMYVRFVGVVVSWPVRLLRRSRKTACSARMHRRGSSSSIVHCHCIAWLRARAQGSGCIPARARAMESV
jgi:hypothetical protein